MDILYKMYSKTIIKQNYYQGKAIRLLIKLFFNIFIPIFYQVTFVRKRKKSNVIVSLTSFPKRINRTWIVVESILRQSRPPLKIVLTLSRLQFDTEDSLPKKLLALKSKGLEILWTEDDLKSHKKYYYVMQKYPNNIIVTIDDDFIYAKKMLSKLLEFHARYPHSVITNLGLEKNGTNYHDWKNILFSSYGPTYNVMQLGGSGVLYPPHSMHSDVFNKELILKYCPLSDDIWLNTMTILNNVTIVKTNYEMYLIPLIFRDNLELYKTNVLRDGNNKQILSLISLYPKIFECNQA